MIKPFILVVLDGWGYRDENTHNAVANARTPFFDLLWQKYPHALLDASGESVGLPAGQMGNSEVGHMTIGAGRPLDTDLVRINKAIKNNEFQNNKAFQDLFDHVKKCNSAIHVKGLLSPGGIHSHEDHLHAFLRLAQRQGINKVYIHAFTDGRDTPPKSAVEYLKKLESLLEELGVGRIASVSGRYYAMDRDKNWDRVLKTEEAIFEAKNAPVYSQKPSEVVAKLYANGKTDEHIEPVIFADEEGNTFPVNNNDAIFFFNFRADRARMLTARTLERAKERNLFFVSLTEYDERFESIVAFPPLKAFTSLANEISKHGLKQVHIAETEKYAHATYFLNVGTEEPYPGEKHVLVKSRSDIATHDQAPEMMAREITDEALKWIDVGCDFIFINYANADMVGHTAQVEAIHKAVETVDAELERLVGYAQSKGGAVFITADHGNAEVNIDPETGERHTAHTTSPVPAILTRNEYTFRLTGTLADVTPTIFGIIGIKKPSSMTGESLII